MPKPAPDYEGLHAWAKARAGAGHDQKLREAAVSQVAYTAGRVSEAQTAVRVRTATLEERLRAAVRAGMFRLEAEAMTRDLGFEVTAMVHRVFQEAEAEKFDVTGRDTVMWCLAHRRKVRWLPNPAWWIHDDHGPLTGGPGDRRGCSSMRAADAPIEIRRKASWT